MYRKSGVFGPGNFYWFRTRAKCKTSMSQIDKKGFFMTWFSPLGQLKISPELIFWNLKYIHYLSYLMHVYLINVKKIFSIFIYFYSILFAILQFYFFHLPITFFSIAIFDTYSFLYSCSIFFLPSFFFSILRFKKK